MKQTTSERFNASLAKCLSSVLFRFFSVLFLSLFSLSSALAKKEKGGGDEFAITISSNIASLTLVPQLNNGTSGAPFDLNQELVIEVLMTGKKRQEYDLTISFPALCSSVLGENRVLLTPDSTNSNTDIGVLAGIKIADLDGKVYYSYAYPGETDQSPHLSATCNNNTIDLFDPDFKIDDKTDKDTLAITLVYDVNGAVELSSSGVLSVAGADGEPFSGVYTAIFEATSTSLQ